MEKEFKVHSLWEPAGDQINAIKESKEYFDMGCKNVVINGATGTGKSATTAWIIEKMQLPTLVLAPNKVLAAQLAAELRELLPDNAVRYFVSHFAYYRPEAYVPTSDTYIEKDSSIDDAIERLRHEATTALLSRKDTVIVASVSAIYGLGRPEEYLNRALTLNVGMKVGRDEVIKKLVSVGYERNDLLVERGKMRVKGDTLDIIPADSEYAIRIEWFGDEIENLALLDTLSMGVLENPPVVMIFPQTHHVVEGEAFQRALIEIEKEMEAQVKFFTKQGRLLEAERIRVRTNNDLEQMKLTGSCKGIENYSRHFDERAPESAPSTLLDYFPKEFLLVIDESHVTIPQIEAMYFGDRSRKQTLVDFGFRLPSALDNRPLKKDEFWAKIDRTLFLSATPALRELSRDDAKVVELIIRPTGLVDPIIEVRKNNNRLEDILQEIKNRIPLKERTLITTLTKRQAEQLNDFLIERKIKSRFMHSDIDTVERINILRELRTGKIDVVVGVNLLREGLDLPEVSLVVILDADSEGFLRSTTSLIQTIGRAARNPKGLVIFYADRESKAMKEAIGETNRRREKQLKYNHENNITPTALSKPMYDLMIGSKQVELEEKNDDKPKSKKELISWLESEILNMQKLMKESSKALKFEEAAALRDQINEYQKELREIKTVF